LACMACSVTTSLLWSFATRRMPNNEAVFRYGMYWDGAMYFAWFFTSLVLLSVRPSLMTLAGTGVMLAGIVMVKLGE